MILALLALSTVSVEARPSRTHTYFGGGSYPRPRPACGFGNVTGVDQPKSGEWGCQNGEPYIYRPTVRDTLQAGFNIQAQDSWRRQNQKYDEMRDAQDYADQVANAPASGASLREQIRPMGPIEMPEVKWPPQ